jgi:transcriptional regulator with XRE-family HTH domain
MDIGQRIFTLRAKQKFKTSQAQVALQLGITPGHYGNIENGAKLPSLDLLLKLADYFRVSVDYLLRGDENAEITIVSGSSIQPEPTVFDLLPIEISQAMATFAEVLLDYQNRNQEEIIADYLANMLNEIDKVRGQNDANEFLAALNEFTSSGDDRALRRWLAR